MSQSFHPPRSKNRCNRKRLDRLPLGERRNELLPRVLGYYTRLCALPRRTRRALVRQWRRSLSAIALLLALGQAPALAATINVDGTICTLVDAITSANTDAAAGGCPTGNGADTIVLPTKSAQSLAAVDNTTHGPTGLPVISSTITIRGRNSTIRRESDAPEFRILAVASSGDLTLHSTTVSGGSGVFLQYLNGGGIANYGGTLTITNSSVSDNGVGYGGDGGGVYNNGTLTLTNSTVSGNGCGACYGGGIANTGTLTGNNSAVTGNTADYGRGGGVDNRGTLTLSRSTVSDNHSRNGGGMSNTGTAKLIDTTVSGNNTFTCCGSGYIATAGGGIANTGTLTVRNSTVSGNSTGIYGGGGLSNGFRGASGSILTLSNSTVSDNNSIDGGGGVVNRGTLARTLISGNESYSSPREREVESSGTVVANNHNLFGHDEDAGVVGFSPGPTDIVPSEGLGAIFNTTLANNGGPTRTHALIAGSPAIDASPDDADCAATDQRGVTRPQGAACDIGAFEKGPPVRCNGRIARILGTVGNDRLTGTPGPDVIDGLAGRDIIDGLEGNDIICGGTGDDKLFGGSGADALNGGSGTDICKGGSGTDKGASCETTTSIP